MMIEKEEIIDTILSQMPDKKLFTANDLLDLGIVANVNSLSVWRRKGKGPEWVRISKGKIRYPRELLKKWFLSLNGVSQ